MALSFLSVSILSCKIISLVCLFVSIYSYHWFRLDDVVVDRHVIDQLCASYGAFCNATDPMPLPRLVIVLPCILAGVGLLLELIDLSLLYFSDYHIRSILNFFLEQTSIALSFAITIHCTWVSAVHIRIAMEIVEVQLHRTFFAFALVTILLPIDCICSLTRMMKHCQYERTSHVKRKLRPSRHRHMPVRDSDI